MIQIDMPMPESCSKCPFLDYEYKICPILPMDPVMHYSVSLSTNERCKFCPLQEVPEKKDFEFEIPEKCGDCKSMTPYGEKYYCHMDAISPENSQQDISTIFVNPESRPVWCPTVKMNETFKAMPPERKEQFNKIATGLSALFGSVQVKKEEE